MAIGLISNDHIVFRACTFFHWSMHYHFVSKTVMKSHQMNRTSIIWNYLPKVTSSHCCRERERERERELLFLKLFEKVIKKVATHSTSLIVFRGILTLISGPQSSLYLFPISLFTMKSGNPLPCQTLDNF